MTEALVLDPACEDAAEVIWRTLKKRQAGRAEPDALDPVTEQRVQALLAKAAPGAPAAQARNALAELALIAPDDARLASDLVAGVTRLRRRLDFLLTPLVRGGVDRLDPALHQLLRIGLYDLLERRTPAHAAVSGAVTAAHLLSHRGGVALVNGVLRTAARTYSPDALPRPAATASSPRRTSASTSAAASTPTEKRISPAGMANDAARSPSSSTEKSSSSGTSIVV